MCQGDSNSRSDIITFLIVLLKKICGVMTERIDGNYFFLVPRWKWTNLMRRCCQFQLRDIFLNNISMSAGTITYMYI